MCQLPAVSPIVGTCWDIRLPISPHPRLMNVYKCLGLIIDFIWRPAMPLHHNIDAMNDTDHHTKLKPQICHLFGWIKWELTNNALSFTNTELYFPSTMLLHKDEVDNIIYTQKYHAPENKRRTMVLSGAGFFTSERQDEWEWIWEVEIAPIVRLLSIQPLSANRLLLPAACIQQPPIYRPTGETVCLWWSGNDIGSVRGVYIGTAFITHG